MIKSCSGIVAALAVLCCCSQAEAGDAATAKLMADRPGSQGPEWILYEDLPEDGEIVSFNKVGDDGVECQVCQSEDGDIGTVSQTQGGAVCDTREGEEDTFYVLILGEQVDDDYEADGVCIVFCRSWPYVLYEQPVLESFQRQNGVDMRDLDPFDDLHSSAAMKLHLARELTRRVLYKMAGGAS